MVDKEFEPDELEDNEKTEEPAFEPDCSSSERERAESGVECEFENRDSSWWCTTHNCQA